MRITQAAGRTDAGRRRRINEDAFVCEPPLFAVADGMGGAQAGELASRLAAASVGGADLGERSGRERVVGLIHEANRSVYERAESDRAAAGMGTTLTVAVVEDAVAWIGHVGDSRAYLLRDSGIDQLTDDHSLVAELVRSGRLTPEEADHHPHRSVITRALGTEPDVEVDAFPVPLQAGDVVLICSDGLPTMVGGEDILALVDTHRPDLEAAAQALVDAANAAGGEDNVTVVLFEVAPDENDGSAVATPADDEDTLHGVPSPFTEPTPEPSERRRRRPGTTAALVATGATVLLAGSLAVLGLARSHFVGAEPNGRVAVYQGIPWELGLGVRLYRLVEESTLVTASLSQAERRRLFDHDLVTRAAAEARIEEYARDVVP